MKSYHFNIIKVDDALNLLHQPQASLILVGQSDHLDPAGETFAVQLSQPKVLMHAILRALNVGAPMDLAVEMDFFQVVGLHEANGEDARGEVQE